MSESRDYLAVVAIDLGTSYSGYAFQTRADCIDHPTRIHAPHWYFGETQLVMNKTISSILFNPQGEFDSFGYEAERKFADLLTDDGETEQESDVTNIYTRDKEQGDANKWYFLRHFKMQLYKEENISQRMNVLDYFEKRIKAINVFSAAIQFLRERALAEFKNAFGDILGQTDVQWVLTVPAIWGDKAKQFMRMAAEKAGIPHAQLMLALEPEVAAFFCKDHEQKCVTNSNSTSLTVKPFDEGCSFLVVDCGGGTVDMTTFRIENGAMKELQQASGGDVGGEKVNQAFFDIWIDVLGEENMAEIQSKYPSEILDFLNSFQLLKQQVNAKKSSVSISLPQCILENISQGSILLDKYKINIKRGKAIIPSSVMWKLFEDPVRKIVQHVESQLHDLRAKEVTNILMVGGFSQCSLLHDRLVEGFKTHRVIRPLECNLAVLKGAVMYGSKPNTICERITRFSYGISSSLPFDQAKYEAEECKKHQNIVDGQVRLEDVFSTFVKYGEPVTPGMKSETKTCRVLNSCGHDIVEVYVSDSAKVPMFVNKGMDGCTKLGVVEINSRGGEVRDRYYDVTMYFGYTELRVTATDKETSQEVEATLKLI
ncbi:heat shock 70 kDa protein 12A-like isoform X2 [Mizuhopecten yessoensis]|uniref:Heat shock 70 kDa protein n=2 Tax=Mizuhopecten yessoensis TaxID=6573 RepID=A0A1C9U309_MIZYE|nr:heat shock 70 kDa protein 12A-like isoform X2 [Mizuhopecten yessoensis]XP_021340722.1 heat shock 70 kDa protein 12A-like isoform X2 [Mizuhopecten yessoensis]AOR17387.1 heat shock 70 kDa protein [Mizuhopecten yessoensis]OWF36337.1 Heat shock 70 kDa protein 12A [Mizuhopecten yessoensis]